MEPNAANHVPLSPVSFLARAAVVEPDRIASVYGERRLTWREVETRCRGLASALRRRGLRTGQTVSVLAPNLPELLELQFAIPMAGGVLNTINLRLDAETIAYILDHGESQLVFCDAELTPLLEEAFAFLGRRLPVVLLEAEAIPVEAAAEGESVPYEAFLEEGDSEETFGPPEDEWQAIALNYTSGTSGRPKGVVYHHRGAYLMALGTLVGWSLPRHPVYLSVVPFFHCNGWQHPWALALVGGTMVFTRRLQPELLFAAIAREGVTHFGAAPVVLSLLAASEHAPAVPFDPPIQVLTAGAPPAPAILERTAALGLEVMQVYGLTETYGHISHCLWREEWDSLPPAEQAEKQALQGVAFPVTEEFAVLDRSTGRPVPPDGATAGEIAIRGNTVMKGYLKDPETTAQAFAGGYFWSGDAAVVHPDGYVQIRDRLKDVIISGGENISSVEVEGVLHQHPAVQAAAVVAMPSEKWGESPCAFLELRPGAHADPEEIVAFCQQRLARFKVPKAIVFAELPKTATGKIQKFRLRERARKLAADPA